MKTRSQSIQIASSREFDLVVIGGGIAGAGVAQDAASRGQSVILLEKDDFASGTSSRTTKLIHGGLRYLEQFQFKLSRQLCQERSLLEKLAPHMVREFSFVMPLSEKDPLFSLKASIGLSLYDVLSWPIAGVHHHRRLSRKEVLESVPALSVSKLSGGLRFFDCITDDSRLVLEVVKSACQEGALAINYMEVVDFQLDDGQIKAVTCHDRYTGKEITIPCRVCVNASGVWTDRVCKILDPAWKNHVTPSKGIHIIVPPSAFETNTALFLPSGDGRYVFVVPWQRALMIGTTDRLYTGELDKPLPETDEIEYLLGVVNSYTNSHKIKRSDITGSFAGLRPLVQPDHDQSNTGNISREHSILEGPGGIINVTGGKLTNYRLMAADVVDKVFKKLPHATFQPSWTKHIMLGGWSNKSNFLALTAAISAKARKLSIEPATLDHLISTYGAAAQLIIDIVEQDTSLNERICPDFPPIMAEIPYSVSCEMVVSLEDFLMRRLRLGILHQKQCLESAPKVAEVMQQMLKWDKERTASELHALQSTLQESMNLLSVPVG